MKKAISKILKKSSLAGYNIILLPEDDGRYSAEVLEMDGCFAYGSTPDEVLRRIEKTAASWMATMKAAGKPEPAPTGTTDYSGKLVLRLPRGVHQRAAIFAQKDAVSLNQFLSAAIAEKIGARAAFEQFSKLASGIRPQIVLNIHHHVNTATAKDTKAYALCNSSTTEPDAKEMVQ